MNILDTAPGAPAAQGSWMSLPARAVSGAIEVAVSRRGLPVLFLVLAAILASAGWIRPPLSPDVRALHIPLGIVHPGSTPPEHILHPEGRIPVDSAGVVLLAMIGVGAVFVLFWPELLSVVAGLLLCAALAVNAAAALNHPALVEHMDREYEQRQQIVAVLNATPGEQPLTTTRNGRTSALLGAPSADEQRGDLVRGWVYLLYGRWLILWASLGVLLGSTGGAVRRLGSLSAWLVLGLGLSAAACFPRLHAEYYWTEAQRLEGRCEYTGAHRALETAVGLFPTFEGLERTRLLAGKIEFAQGRATPAANFFRAYQLARDRGQPRAVAYQEDLPWLIEKATDYRKGTNSPPVGFDLIGNPPTETNDAGAPEYSEGEEHSHGRYRRAYHLGRNVELRHARGLMETLAASPDARSADHRSIMDVPVRRQTARLWTDAGLVDYLLAPVLTDSGLDYSRRERKVFSAREAWFRAMRLDGPRLDCALYLGLAQAQLEPFHPESVEVYWSPIIRDVADRAILADVLAELGDAYLTAGDAAQARRRFAESFDRLNLPRKKNYRAQKGMGGL